MSICRLGVRFDLLGSEGGKEEIFVDVGHLVWEVSVWHRRRVRKDPLGEGTEGREGAPRWSGEDVSCGWPRI